MADFLLSSTTVIRPSSLPGWADCARREAARLFRDIIETGGFTLRSVPDGAAAAVGSAVHEAAHYTLDEKIKTGELGSDSEAEDRAITTFNEKIERGVMWDDTTRRAGDAHVQIQKMTRTYRSKVAPLVDPVSVEDRLEVHIDTDIICSGQRDVLAREPGAIRDLKTGARQSANAAQYGAYSILHRSHEPDNPIERIFEDFIKRVGVKTTQPDPVHKEYNVLSAEWAARDTIDDIVRSLREFRERLKKGHAPPEGAFRANPRSMLCSSKYCTAFNTNFCKLHLQED